LVDFPASIANMPLAEWASAIDARHSARTYTGRPVDPAALAALSDLCARLPGQSVARVVIVEKAPTELFTGLVVGSYGRVMGANSALLVIGKPAERAVQESMGYLGEAVVLQATAAGLGTCWIAGSFDRHVASELADLAPDERIFAVSPLGYAKERPRRGERLLKAMVRAKHRRPLEEVAPGFDAEQWPGWAAEGVRSARIAPSAVNRQPWLFELEHGSVLVSVLARGAEGSISRLLDVGIAMLHFEVGARLMGASGTWELLEPPRVARYRPAGG
jgi:nitroreductase